MAQISVPTPENYIIGQRVLDDLLHEVDPTLEERPEVWTRAVAALVQPGLELLVAGLRAAWQRRRNRQRALQILARLAGQEPTGRLRSPPLRAIADGYRLATRTNTGAVAAPLFINRMLDVEGL
ncbi:MAG: hypothetical protein ACYC05_04985 [Sulfuricella sp.]